MNFIFEILGLSAVDGGRTCVGWWSWRIWGGVVFLIFFYFFNLKFLKLNFWFLIDLRTFSCLVVERKNMPLNGGRTCNGWWKYGLVWFFKFF